MDLDLLEGGIERQMHSNPYEDSGTADSNPLRAAFGGGDDSTNGGMTITIPTTSTASDAEDDPYVFPDAPATPRGSPPSISEMNPPNSEPSTITSPEDQMEQLTTMLNNPLLRDRARSILATLTASLPSPHTETGAKAGHNG